MKSSLYRFIAPSVMTTMHALVMTVLMMLMGAAVSYADGLYTIPVGATVTIDEHGQCREVTNPAGQSGSRFVSAKTAPEWQSVLDNPNALLLNACPPPCSGVEVGGHCWYSSAAGQSCTQVCASLGGVNIEGTRDFAGSGGTLANCVAVSTALGWAHTSSGDSSGCSGGTQYMGCTLRNVFSAKMLTRCTNAATTEGSSYSNYQRACACNGPTEPAENLVNNQHNTHQCLALGGTIITSGSNKFCRLNQSSCPAGWTAYENWTTYGARTCTTGECSSSCTTGSRAWANSTSKPSSCSYSVIEGSGMDQYCSSRTCEAAVTQRGCY